MGIWRKTKSGTRRGIYALIDAVDSLWWAIIAVVALIVASVVWGGMGFLVGVGVIALAIVFLWLFGDDDSADATAASIKRGQCLPNIAKSAYDNAMHDDH